MKLPKSCLIGLIAISSICFNWGFIEKASANDKYCDGAECEDKDPVEYRCDSDAYVVEQVTKIVYRSQDSWQPTPIVIQQIYSEKCNANWTRAYVPDDAFLFIRKRDLVNGSQPMQGMVKANGTEYFWTYGKMSNGDVANQACVAIPIVKFIGHDLYDRHCTGFNYKKGNSVQRL
jgi:hypothetical protein